MVPSWSSAQCLNDQVVHAQVAPQARQREDLIGVLGTEDHLHPQRDGEPVPRLISTAFRMVAVTRSKAGSGTPAISA